MATITVANCHVTNGSAAVTTTASFASLKAGNVVSFSSQSTTSYTILSIASNTSLTLTANYTGTTSTTATLKMSDNGTSSYVGPSQRGSTSATILSAPDVSHGTYGGSQFAVVTLAVTGSTGTQSTFKMTGWYAIGNVWETWTSTGSPNISPPSGHTLTFITYVVTSGAAN
jgi:hypothetical protein